MTINDLGLMAEKEGIRLSSSQLEQFQKYYELLVEWNSFMNLTAITEFDEVIVKHFLDSILLVKAASTDVVSKAINGDKVTLVDVGTGAGFPAVPIKIAFPNIKVTLIDSLNKRIKFLNEVISVLGLTDIEAIHSRAEEGAAGKLREKYDIAVSRAVANLSTLSEYCLPYVKVGGVFVAYKSEELLSPRKMDVKELEELDKNSIKYLLTQKCEKDVCGKAVTVLGGSIENIYEYSLIDNYRCLCVIRKEKVTPKKYPRKAGLPGKEPIL